MITRWFQLVCVVCGLGCGPAQDPAPSPGPSVSVGADVDDTPDDSPSAASVEPDDTLVGADDTADDLHACSSAADCVAVGCRCTCSGCGGFSSEDIINRAHESRWYEQQGCEPYQLCPEVCCPDATIECRAGMCIVVRADAGEP